MAERKKKVVDSAAEAKSDAAASDSSWVPTPGSKKKATTFRWIAAVLWAVAIAAEAVAIFWLLRQRDFVGEDGTLVRNSDTGLLETENLTPQFPQWAFIALIVALVVIAALSITGSILWKKANRLDPAKKADKFRFFVQNQLGAIIAIIAFLPLIILIFLNKDMNKGQKATAGIIGIVLAAVAVAFGIDYNPASVEQYNADQSAVIQLLGQDEVVWVEGGSVYHVCDQVSDIQTGSEKITGTTAEAIGAGKGRLTLKFVSELRACDLAVPENAEEITEALRAIQGGAVETLLPQPVWADSSDDPLQLEEASAE